MSFKMPALPAVPAAPPAPPMFGQQGGQGQKPKQRQLTPSFLGTDMSPTQGQLGTNTLLGQ